MEFGLKFDTQNQQLGHYLKYYDCFSAEESNQFLQNET